MCHFKILIKHEFINIRLIPTQISSFLEHFLLDHHFSFIYQILFKRKSIYTYIYIYIYKNGTSTPLSGFFFSPHWNLLQCLNTHISKTLKYKRLKFSLVFLSFKMNQNLWFRYIKKSEYWLVKIWKNKQTKKHPALLQSSLLQYTLTQQKTTSDNIWMIYSWISHKISYCKIKHVEYFLTWNF